MKKAAIALFCALLAGCGGSSGGGSGGDWNTGGGILGQPAGNSGSHYSNSKRDTDQLWITPGGEPVQIEWRIRSTYKIEGATKYYRFRGATLIVSQGGSQCPCTALSIEFSIYEPPFGPNEHKSGNGGTGVTRVDLGADSEWLNQNLWHAGVNFTVQVHGKDWSKSVPLPMSPAGGWKD